MLVSLEAANATATNERVVETQREAGERVVATHQDVANKVRDARDAYEAELWGVRESLGAQL
jgi:hypothetical protein